MQGDPLLLGPNQAGLNRDPSWAALAGDDDSCSLAVAPAFMN